MGNSWIPTGLTLLRKLDKLTKMMTLGQYLRKLRDDRDLSLREFARKIERSAAFVSDIELGRRYPSEKVLALMANVLGVSVEELKSYDSRPPIEDLKRLSESDPMFAYAFRAIVGRPEELKKFVRELDRPKKRKKG